MLLLLLVCPLLAHAHYSKRVAPSDFNLFAYGKTFGAGATLIESDGYVYCTTANVTEPFLHFTPGGTDDSTWYVSNNSSSTSSSVLYFDIGTGPHPQLAVGDPDNLPSTAVSSGFTLFGQQVMYLNSTSQQLQAQFWAMSHTNLNSEVWAITWNTHNNSTGNNFPIVVKDVKPTIPDN